MFYKENLISDLSNLAKEIDIYLYSAFANGTVAIPAANVAIAIGLLGSKIRRSDDKLNNIESKISFKKMNQEELDSWNDRVKEYENEENLFSHLIRFVVLSFFSEKYTYQLGKNAGFIPIQKVEINLSVNEIDLIKSNIENLYAIMPTTGVSIDIIVSLVESKFGKAKLQVLQKNLRENPSFINGFFLERKNQGKGHFRKEDLKIRHSVSPIIVEVSKAIRAVEKEDKVK